MGYPAVDPEAEVKFAASNRSSLAILSGSKDLAVDFDFVFLRLKDRPQDDAV